MPPATLSTRPSRYRWRQPDRDDLGPPQEALHARFKPARALGLTDCLQETLQLQSGSYDYSPNQWAMCPGSRLDATGACSPVCSNTHCCAKVLAAWAMLASTIVDVDCASSPLPHEGPARTHYWELRERLAPKANGTRVHTLARGLGVFAAPHIVRCQAGGEDGRLSLIAIPGRLGRRRRIPPFGPMWALWCGATRDPALEFPLPSSARQNGRILNPGRFGHTQTLQPLGRLREAVHSVSTVAEVPGLNKTR